MLRYLFLLFSAILLTGCQNKKSNVQTMRYHDDGRAKPIVTVAPLLDSSSYEIPWSISEELTHAIQDRLTNQGDIFVLNQEDIHLSNDNNPFGTDINWIKKTFKPTEFVVFLELIEHEEVPVIKTTKDSSRVSESRRRSLNMNVAMRIRIVDLRSDSPNIILQEMIRDSYYVPNSIDKTDYNIVQWGSEEYKTSPMGMAHAQFTKNIIQRINDYIMLAKSR